MNPSLRQSLPGGASSPRPPNGLSPPEVVIAPNDFATLDIAERRLLDFQQYFQQIATPFQWNFTRRKLKKLLERLDQHGPHAQAA
jgi:hypothetical protein